MARYEIQENQFCGLSKEITFQEWLKNISPSLYKDLLTHLNTSASCKSNTSKMINIQNKLIEIGKGVNLVNFLREKFPNTVLRVDDVQQAQKVAKILPRRKETTATEYLESIDESIVFRFYNPHLLTFPLKAVFRNIDTIALRKDVMKFLSDKYDGDYVIVGNKAYIEFFKSKHEKEAQLIPKQKREVYQYRMRVDQ